MGWFDNQSQIDENLLRERLSRLSEKELLIELILELEIISRKCDRIARKIVVWSD